MNWKKITAIFGIVGALIALGYAIYNYFSATETKQGNVDSLAKAREAKARLAEERKLTPKTDENEGMVSEE